MRMRPRFSTIPHRVLAVVVACGALTSCSDRTPTFGRVPARLQELAPLPSGAVTVTVESLGDVDPTWPLYYSGSEPRVSFWNLRWHWDLLRTGSRYPLLSPDQRMGDWARIMIDDGVRASAVRVTAYASANGFAMVCETASGTAVTTRIPGSLDGWTKGVLDVQAPDITYCHFVGYGAIESFSFVPQRKEQLVLSCIGNRGLNTVTRGSTLRCEAKKEPGSSPGDITVTRWSFDGKERSDGDLTSNIWEGVMVRDGVVQVEARIGDAAVAPATAPIVVEDREWSGKAPSVTVREARNGEDGRLTLAPKVTWAHDLGATSFFSTPTPADPPLDPTAVVDGGPNDGLYYFPNDFTFSVVAIYVLNRAAMSRGSGFYNAQEQDAAGGGQRLGGMNWCSRSVVTGPLLALVEAHEVEHVRVIGTPSLVSSRQP